MRTLVILRGVAGCGKSTWIKKNKLERYTLSSDDIRMLYQGLVMDGKGRYSISQANNSKVFATLYDMLDARMSRGEFTVVDATHTTKKSMDKYKEMAAKYRYRIYCVDFSDVPLKTALDQNAAREEYKRVPGHVIVSMYQSIKKESVPSGIKVIKPDEIDKIWFNKIDLSGYKKIHHIGDIHGCFSCLSKYIQSHKSINPDEFYIFTGDYFDRGIENAEVFFFLTKIMNKPNVLLLEGNHERWLNAWSNDEEVYSKDFLENTKLQFEKAGISKAMGRKLHRKLAQCAYYEYNGNTYFVTHGGLAKLQENITLIPTDQMIHGTGSHADDIVMAQTFTANTPDNYYQIHGHRNNAGVSLAVSDTRDFNLECKVEFGGFLRCLDIDENGAHSIEIKNEVHQNTMPSIVRSMQTNPNIKKKDFGKISSFNFTRDAFNEGIWDYQTTKARGLFIDMEDNKVVARSYDKFFNVDERPETTKEALIKNIKFPVTGYVKENGFLGILSWDKEHDDLLFATKSSIEGDYVEYFRNIFYSKIVNLEYIKKYIKDNDVTTVFECVDVVNDPHIIAYTDSALFLLDIIRNDIEYSHLSYDELLEVCNNSGLTPKKKAFIINNSEELERFFNEIDAEDYQYNGEYIEGFVIEDASSFMFKAKTQYYKYWKYMRSIICNKEKLLECTESCFIDWLVSVYDVTSGDFKPGEIIKLRQEYYSSTKIA